ncbi:hypothetical protein, partial [Tenacibaculum platacis]|uniref:hypothetical protein n=1 Tax=Tenacibaculum platacis TaxID=3137852 RepID=UPI00399D6D69
MGDNPNTIDINSILELESSDKVFILTRVTSVQMNAITPLEGALVYNTDIKCIYQYDGTNWVSLCDTSPARELSFDPVTNILTISDGNNVDLSPLINDADADPTNEVNLSFRVNGGNLEITDSNGTLSVPLSDIAAQGATGPTGPTGPQGAA